ncbi:Cof-type HAD-IIB family hydrolase [Paenibacillus illinoisensis]|uniref:Cof-type HAD-IIB family hydrolase n=1 Tax=Paenibacillus illinoisensis TaxID=59845 RepID=UPI00301CECD0
MTIKLIALDVDGTLLNDHHELTEWTQEILIRASRQGAEIVLCSGRGPANTIPFMKRMGLDGYVITHNGAVTAEVESREIVHRFAMDGQGLEPFVTYCRTNGVHFDINTAFGLYVDQPEGLELQVREMYNNFMMEPLKLPQWADLSEPLAKFTAFGPIEQMDKVQQEWGTWNLPYYMTRSGDFFIDLMHPEASKGAALKRLAESKGIVPSEILAIGNYYNDITMLTYAGKGIAMDNSPEEVKAAADEVTLSNNEQGVALAVQKHVLAV